MTSRAIAATWVSRPMFVARTTSTPSPFIAVPTTSESGSTSTGTLSPVSIDMSTEDDPSMTTPSVAIRLPGATTNTSSTCNASTSTMRVVPSARRTSTVSPAVSSRAFTASPMRCFDRCSNHLPASTIATVVDATSKYRWSPPPVNDIVIDIPISPADVVSNAHTDHANEASTPMEMRVSMVVSP